MASNDPEEDLLWENLGAASNDNLIMDAGPANFSTRNGSSAAIETNATESEQADEGGAPCITAAKGDQKMLRKKWAAVLLLLVAAWWLISICEWSLLWADDKVQEEEWIRMAKLKDVHHVLVCLMVAMVAIIALQVATVKELYKLIREQAQKIRTLSKEANDLKKSNDIWQSMIKHLLKAHEDASSAKIKFIEMPGFLRTKQHSLSSEIFRCNGLSFFLYLTKSMNLDGEHDLAVYLRLHPASADLLDHLGDWSASVTFDLSLMKPARGEKDTLKRSSNHVFEKNKESKWVGWHRFVSADYIPFYVDDGIIRFEVEIKSLKFEAMNVTIDIL